MTAQHCDHEGVCKEYREAFTSEPCDGMIPVLFRTIGHSKLVKCGNDTRSRPHTSAEPVRNMEIMECFAEAFDMTDDMCQCCPDNTLCHISYSKIEMERKQKNNIIIESEQARRGVREKVLVEIKNLDCETCKDYHKSGCPVWCGGTPRACIDHSELESLREKGE